MDYLHPPLLPPDDEALFSAYLHPPMLPNWEGNKNDNSGDNRQQQDGGHDTNNSDGKLDGVNGDMQMHQDASHDLSQLVYHGDYVMSDAMQMYFKDH